MPEIWLSVAERTGIAELKRTTRDVPVYDDLMRYRMDVLERNDLKLSTIREVIGGLEPLPGAGEFLRWARRNFQVAILSDTFYEFGMALMAKLDYPLLLCHRLTVQNDRIVGYRLRQDDPKREAVRAFHSLNYRVLAAGDSFNDTAMLEEADAGVFFNAPANVVAEFPEFDAVDSYDALAGRLEELSRTASRTAFSRTAFSNNLRGG